MTDKADKQVALAQDPQNYWEQLERIERLNKASELKAGVIFSFHSLILGFLVDHMDILTGLFSEYVLFTSIFAIWLLLVLVSIYFCFRCFTPRLELKFKKSIFFFRDAARSFGDVSEFCETYIRICSNEEELYSQLSQQIYIESMVVNKKFVSVQRSLRFFALSFAAIMILIIFWAMIV